MELNKELFDAIGSQAVKAMVPEPIRLPGEPDHIYGIRTQDGIAIISAEPATVNHKIYTQKGMLDLIASRDDLSQSSLWYSMYGITFLFDAARRDRATMAFNMGEQFRRLIEWDKNPKAMKQNEILSELRVRFHDAISLNGNLVPILQKVKFNVDQSGHSDVTHGKVSIGKKLDAEITGTGIIPETIKMFVPVFAQCRSIRATIVCALEPCSVTQTFQIIPLPGEIDKGIELVVEMVGQQLRDALTMDEEGETAGNNLRAIFHGMP